MFLNFFLQDCNYISSLLLVNLRVVHKCGSFTTLTIKNRTMLGRNYKELFLWNG